MPGRLTGAPLVHDHRLGRRGVHVRTLKLEVQVCEQPACLFPIILGGQNSELSVVIDVRRYVRLD